MKAIAIFSKTHNVEIIDAQEPDIQSADDVKLKVLEVGICGTDRDEVTKGVQTFPSGENHLIIGHEMLGEVVKVGTAVTQFKPKDLAIVTVRRSCNRCSPCKTGAEDMCSTGQYQERGIKGLHGFQSEFVIDQEKNLIPVPASSRQYAVLTEPMSIVEKGLDEILRMQINRLPEYADPSQWQKKRVLISGLGPVGLLSAVALRVRGFQVFGLDIVDSDSARVKALQRIEGTYIDGKQINASEMTKKAEYFDMIVGATGIATLDFALLDTLGCNGACLLLGIPADHSSIQIPGGRLIHNIVMNNQVILGSVNAKKKHWESAIKNLQQANEKWAGAIENLITARVHYQQFKSVLFQKNAEEIKSTLVWDSRS